jgi:L-ascorbate metabolism protein UlaG (beta-lactamase superfamily)
VGPVLARTLGVVRARLPGSAGASYGRRIAGSEPSLTYLGHASVALDLAGGRIVTDPILRGRVGYLRRVAVAPGADAMTADVVLVSHVHHDHLDGPSLRRFGSRTPVAAPRGSRRLLMSKGVLNVVELLPGESVRMAGATVNATEAEHETTRLPGGRRVPALGFVIVDGGLRIFFAGDTDLFDGMEAIGDVGLDVALVPITGWGPRVPPGHMNPVSAAQSLRLLRPRIAVPIHWGTLAPIWWRRRSATVMREPAEQFAREAAQVAPGVDVRIVPPGESLAIGAAPSLRTRMPASP